MARNNCRGFFSEDQRNAEERFELLRGGPYATALLDCEGNILMHYGRYNIKHPIWLELKSWWEQKLSGDEYTLTNARCNDTLPGFKELTPKDHAHVGQDPKTT